MLVTIASTVIGWSALLLGVGRASLSWACACKRPSRGDLDGRMSIRQACVVNMAMLCTLDILDNLAIAGSYARRLVDDDG